MANFKAGQKVYIPQLRMYGTVHKVSKRGDYVTVSTSHGMKLLPSDWVQIWEKLSRIARLIISIIMKIRNNG